MLQFLKILKYSLLYRFIIGTWGVNLKNFWRREHTFSLKKYAAILPTVFIRLILRYFIYLSLTGH